MSELDRRYYDLESHILATTPLCASRSTTELHKDLPLRTAEWVHKNRGDRLVYGVIRNPFDRAKSAFRKLNPKYMGRLDWFYIFGTEELAKNPHVIPQTELHRGTVDIWIPFEEYVQVLPGHVKSEYLDMTVPPIPRVLFDEFYKEDIEVYESAILRPSVSVGAVLGVGSAADLPGRGEPEAESDREGDDGCDHGVAQPGEVAGTPGEAESAGSEGAGLGDSESGDLERGRGGNPWGTDYYGGSLEGDAEPSSDDGEEGSSVQEEAE